MLKEDHAQTDDWFVDSGATHHMTPDETNLRHYRTLKNCSVKTANAQMTPVEGVGDLVADSGEAVVQMEEVLHVPALARHLISLSKVLDAGVDVQPSSKQLKFLVKGELVAVAKRSGSLFKMKLEPIAEEDDKEEDICAMAVSKIPAAQLVPVLPTENVAKVSEAQLWHQRYGHLSYAALQQLVEKNMVDGMQIKQGDLKACQQQKCHVCIMAKQAALPFDKDVPKATRALYTVNTDLCQFECESLGGNRHMVNFLDSNKKFCAIKLLPKKSGAAEATQDVLQAWEREQQLKVVNLKSDRGESTWLECCRSGSKSMAFSMILLQGIQASGIVQQRRLHRTIQDRARAAIFEAFLPKELWGEAVLYLTLVKNCSPASGLSATPYELWYDTKPDVSRLKVFGCLAYIRQHESKRKKLDPRYLPGVFVGIHNMYGAYRVYMPNGVIRMSKHVIFDESRKGWPLLHTIPQSMPELQEEPGNVVELLDEGIVQNDSTPMAQNDAFLEGVSEVNHPMQQNDASTPDQVVLQEVAGGPVGGNRVVSRIPVLGVSSPVRAFASRYPVRTRIPTVDVYRQYLPEANLCEDESNDTPTMQEALSGSEAAEWLLAIEKQMQSLKDKGVWKHVPFVPGMNAIPCSWLLKRKRDSGGLVAQHKARLVAGGHKQVIGIDCFDTFAPTARASTIKIAMAIAVSKSYVVHHVDIAVAFLHADLKEDIYMQLPDGYYQEYPGMVCKLVKSLYGLKQAPREWYGALSEALGEFGFTVCPADPACFKREGDEGALILVIIVDDLMILSPSEKAAGQFKKEIESKFESRDLGSIEFFNGSKITKHASGEVTMSQPAYVKQLVKAAGMENAKVIAVPMDPGCHLKKSDSELLQGELYDKYGTLLGKLMWLSVSTRPDITFAVNRLARYTAAPTKQHMDALLHVVRYLKGTSEMGLCFKPGEFTVEGQCDSDYASSDLDARKSCSGYVFLINGVAVSWQSKLQGTTTLSTAEAEYMAACAGTKEALWMQQLLQFMGVPQPTMAMRSDNQAALSIMENPVISQKSKHIDVQYHFLREMVFKKKVGFSYLPTSEMVADGLTKALPKIKFQLFRNRLGVK